MKLLILGGTQFVGRHIVEAARAAGHDLTLFNRGQTAADLFPDLEVRRGNRRKDLSALAEGQWDAVIDSCGYLPGEVERSAVLLHGRVGRYVFISSVSAYASFAQGNDEQSPLGMLADPATELVDGSSYGPLKAACEARVQAVFADRALVIRPGLVVGPHDPTQRFTYWPARIGTAGDEEPVLVPGPPEDGLQFVDARDLAAFVLRATERELGGAFNVLNAPKQYTRADLLAACAAVAGVAPQWFWADSPALLALGVKPWTDLPLWLPPEGDFAAFMQTANGAALAAGLQLRPLADTVADTLRWWRGLPAEQQGFVKAGISRDREAQLLDQLRTAAGSPGR